MLASWLVQVLGAKTEVNQAYVPENMLDLELRIIDRLAIWNVAGKYNVVQLQIIVNQSDAVDLLEYFDDSAANVAYIPQGERNVAVEDMLPQGYLQLLHHNKGVPLGYLLPVEYNWIYRHVQSLTRWGLTRTLRLLFNYEFPSSVYFRKVSLLTLGAFIESIKNNEFLAVHFQIPRYFDQDFFVVIGCILWFLVVGQIKSAELAFGEKLFHEEAVAE